MLFRNTVEFPHVALGLVPKVLDAVDVVIAVGEQLRMIDADMMEVRNVERVIACPGVRIDDAIRQDHAVYDRHQGLGAGIGDHLGVDLAAALEDAEDGDLAGGATTAFALSLATEVTFVGLDLAGQGPSFVQLPGDDLTQTVKEVGRRGFVDADQIGRRAGRHFPDKKLKQPVLVFFR